MDRCRAGEETVPGMSPGSYVEVCKSWQGEGRARNRGRDSLTWRKGEEVGVAAGVVGVWRTHPWDSCPVGVYLDPGLGTLLCSGIGYK